MGLIRLTNTLLPLSQILRSSLYTEMLLRQCVGHVRHIGCRGMPLSRRLSASADTRTVERRGDYTMLEDNDVTTFERLLGSSAVLTEPDDVAPYNEDWPRTCKGGWKILSCSYQFQNTR